MNDPDVDILLNEAVTARRAAVAAAARSEREQMVKAAFDQTFADDLVDSYAPAGPRYPELFREFSRWVREDHLSALPASGAVVANYLLRMAMDGEPLAKIKTIADAIRYYHAAGEQFLDEAYIIAASKIIARLNSDDGGGTEVANSEYVPSPNKPDALAAQG